MRKMIACTVLLLILAAQAPAAEHRAGFERGGCGTILAPDRDDMELWCQTTDCSGAFASNVDLGQFAVDTECVDDFRTTSYYALTSLTWWGARVNELDIQFFLVTVYGDDGDCGPDESNVVSEQMIFDFNEQTTECAYFYSYESALDPVPMEPGGHYWLCIRAALEVDPGDAYSEWYWAMHDTDVECPALYRCSWCGFPDWLRPNEAEPGYAPADAMAFCLYTDGTVGNEDKTWSDVKRLYR